MVLPTENNTTELDTETVAQPKINKRLSNVLETLKQSAVDTKTAEEAVSTPKKVNKKKNVEIRGKPKSGRPWKEVKQKFSNIKKSIYRRPTHKKEEFRQEMKHIKELSKSIKEDKKLENEEKRMRREINAKRKLENDRKSEVVQVIKNPAKIKRMKKKALRKIEKRDLTNMKVV